MLRLECQAQNYAWGRPATADCKVAELVAGAGGTVDPIKPYAELWMGTHPSGQSVLADSGGATLKGWLEQHPEALGDRVVQRFGPDLPFLFKVLSVQTALSIQSHPDKALAEQLHSERPQVYKDNNHKPEMAIAISDFEALCGFVDAQELTQVLTSYPELHPCLGSTTAVVATSTSGRQDQREQLKSSFTSLMTCDAAKVATAISTLQKRLEGEAKQRELTPKEALVIRLNQQYPNDVGVLAAFYLNLVRLKEKQAIYLAANEPHAYVSGQIIECMATSDNVVRAGLTPKLRDTEVLCESLTYIQAFPAVLEGEEVQQYTTVYSPPFEEFEVYRLELPGCASTLLPANQGPSILLVQSGSGVATATPSIVDKLLVANLQLGKGTISFVPANTSMALSADNETLVAWIAAVHSQVFGEKFAIPNARRGVLQTV